MGNSRILIFRYYTEKWLQTPASLREALVSRRNDSLLLITVNISREIYHYQSSYVWNTCSAAINSFVITSLCSSGVANETWECRSKYWSCRFRGCGPADQSRYQTQWHSLRLVLVTSPYSANWKLPSTYLRTVKLTPFNTHVRLQYPVDIHW